MSPKTRSADDLRLELSDAIGESREAIRDRNPHRLEAAALQQLSIARQLKSEGWEE